MSRLGRTLTIVSMVTFVPAAIAAGTSTTA